MFSVTAKDDSICIRIYNRAFCLTRTEAGVVKEMLDKAIIEFDQDNADPP